MSNSFILGSIDLNDGVHYFVDPLGVNFGQMQTTWDEEANYASGANVQCNVKRSALVVVTIPMWVQGSSYTDLEYWIEHLWNEVDLPSNSLVHNNKIYTIVYSTRPDTIERDQTFVLSYRAHFTLTLMRQP